jgi:hypothetical protein
MYIKLKISLVIIRLIISFVQCNLKIGLEKLESPKAP